MELSQFNKLYEEQVNKIYKNPYRLRSFLKVVSNNYKYDYKMNVMTSRILPYANSCANKEFWDKYECVINKNQKGIPYINKNNEIDFLFDKTQVTDTVTNKTPKFKLFEFSYPRDYKYINDYFEENTPVNNEEVFQNNILNFSEKLCNKFTFLSKEYTDFYKNSISQIIAFKLNISNNFINDDNFIDIYEHHLEKEFFSLIENTKKELIQLVNYVSDRNRNNESNLKQNIFILNKNDYDKIGLKVIYKNKEYLIEDNNFTSNGQNILKLRSLENNTAKNILYTGRVYNLYVNATDLENFEQDDNATYNTNQKYEEDDIIYDEPDKLKNMDNEKQKRAKEKDISEEIFNVQESDIIQENIILNVGYDYLILEKNELPKDISITKRSNIKGLDMYIGAEYEDSRKIDALFDSGKYTVYKIQELTDYLTKSEPEEQIKLEEKNDNVHLVSNYLGIDENKLRNIMSLNLNENNLNEFGRYDELTKSIDKDKAKDYFEKVEGTKIIPPKVIVKADMLLRDFILSRGTNIKQLEEIENTSELENDTIATKKGTNFTLTGEIMSDTLKPSERLQNNIDAIKTLKLIEHENRTATPEEQITLSKYVGWGGLADTFDEKNDSNQWKTAREFLLDNLTPDEYESAKESTLTSFYTPKILIDSMYKALENMGFKKGNILEPSCGTGNFIGNIPNTLAKSKFYAVEVDTISGKIAKYLYPEANIQIQGFEKTDFSNNLFDVAIGNVPFGEFKLNDKAYNKNNLLIHDYFFAKSIDKIRSGGIIAFITSSGTMDKKDDSFRRYIGARCDLLGAIRLPNDAFKGVAGTRVTSDIVFLQKKNSILDIEQDWYKLDTDENGFVYNKYFIDNPNMVLGDIKEISGRFGNVLACLSNENSNLSENLNNAIKSINGNYSAIDIDDSENTKNLITLPATNDIKNFSYTMIYNNIFYRENSLLYQKDFDDKTYEKIKKYIHLTNAVKTVISRQLDDSSDEKINESRDILNRVYDDFYKNYGSLNSRSNEKILSDDSNYPLVSSIEVLEKDKFKEKGDIFFKRTIQKPIVVDKVDTAEKSLILSITQKGKIDFEYMQSLTDMTKNKLIDDLKGRIFIDIQNINDNFIYPFNKDNFEYLPADEYLSGNIREKIRIIDEHINYIRNYDDDNIIDKDNIEKEISELEFQKNKLKEVMPKDLKASEINVRLGTTWIPVEYYNKFMYETLKTSEYNKEYIKIAYSPLTGEYNISSKSKDIYNNLVVTKYGTSRVNAYKILEDGLNLKDVKVFDTITDEDGKEKKVLNQEETTLSIQKQELIKEEFKDWIYKDYDRRTHLEQIYNTKFNSVVNRHFDGSNLTFDGMNIEKHLRQHQKDAVARALYGKNTLFAHVVGAGKTYAMIASIMESKKLGFSNKALMVVPNHITSQIGREFMELYPSANILVANKKDFEPMNRKKFIGKIATGEYDAVIIGHTQFAKIPMSNKYQENHIRKEILHVIKAIEDYKADTNSNFTVKQLENTKKKLEAKLDSLLDTSNKDDVINFEELGIDKLVVDEAHNYKNLFLYTKMQNVAGIGQSEALKSSDMFMKCRYMDEKTNGTGIIFATGTPVSNTMSEMYTMQRYLSYNDLEDSDLTNFDSWASTFGETVTAIELSPEGTNYRMKTRFSKFYNLPELMTMFKEFADVKTDDMLNLPTPKANYETIVTKPTQIQKDLLLSLSERADIVRKRLVEPNKDNMLKITNDGKKLALDQRLINSVFEDDPNSKVNVCINNVFNLYKQTTMQKSTQVIFCDMSTPSNEFNIYDDIKNKLIAKGISEKEIAFIHDANNDKQKEELFEKVRTGEIRIFLGSTSKCGAGTNFQNKLAYLHDLDVPWRPSDLEQRSGRIVRQGNENKEVTIFRYVTENTFDSYLWVRHEVA